MPNCCLPTCIQKIALLLLTQWGHPGLFACHSYITACTYTPSHKVEEGTSLRPYFPSKRGYLADEAENVILELENINAGCLAKSGGKTPPHQEPYMFHMKSDTENLLGWVPCYLQNILGVFLKKRWEKKTKKKKKVVFSDLSFLFIFFYCHYFPLNFPLLAWQNAKNKILQGFSVYSKYLSL